MRTRSKIVLAVGVAGLSVAAYGVVSTLPSLSPGTVPTTTTTTLPPGTPVGFNAARTEFVLPHNLGYLPAPELALAKVDPAYASGLATTGDWTQIQWPLQNTRVLKLVTSWAYAGEASNSPPTPGVESYQMRVVDIKSAIIPWNDFFVYEGATGLATRLSASSVRVQASTIHAINMAGHGIVPYRTELLAPSTLEVQAAPFTVGGSNNAAFCVPVPEAFLTHGFLSAAKVSTPKTEPVITAGPSAVFAGSNLGTGSPSYYDEGVASCNNFH